MQEGGERKRRKNIEDIKGRKKRMQGASVEQGAGRREQIKKSGEKRSREERTSLKQTDYIFGG